MGITAAVNRRFQALRRITGIKQEIDIFHGSRSFALSCILIFAFVIIALRAISIQLFSPSSEILESLARRQYQAKIDLSPYRGNIFDRRNEPLAISIRRPSIYVNPRAFDPTKKQIHQLSQILSMPPGRIRDLAKKKSYFAWLSRKIDRLQAEKIAALSIPGLHEITEPARYYPNGDSLSHLIGRVGIDNHGLSGVELAENSVLEGVALKAFHNRDARGRSIFRDSLMALPEKNGKNIFLTIDSAIQNVAQTALVEGIKRANAKGGFVIVSDPHTGRILAIANANHEGSPSQVSTKESPRNRALSDIFEPGSVIKPIVIGRALELGLTTLDEVHNGFQGTYQESNWRIRDSHGAESFTTEEILVQSSNIGTYLVAKRLGPERLHQTLLDFGFTQRGNNVRFPGQMFGRLAPWSEWRPVRFGNIAFGQGFYATGLEIVQAFGAIANGGNLMRPYIIDHIESAEGGVIESQTAQTQKRVLTPQTATELRRVLQRVVEEGTGQNAVLTQYTSAGKTGTSEKVDPITKTYSDTLRIASFIGFAPSTDPHLVIYVVIDEPGNKPYYGGTWAAPIFKEIAEESLRYLNVAPDRPKKQETLAKSNQDSRSYTHD